MCVTVGNTLSLIFTFQRRQGCSDVCSELSRSWPQQILIKGFITTVTIHLLRCPVSYLMLSYALLFPQLTGLAFTAHPSTQLTTVWRNSILNNQSFTECCFLFILGSMEPGTSFKPVLSKAGSGPYLQIPRWCVFFLCCFQEEACVSLWLEGPGPTAAQASFFPFSLSNVRTTTVYSEVFFYFLPRLDLSLSNQKAPGVSV